MHKDGEENKKRGSEKNLKYNCLSLFFNELCFIFLWSGIRGSEVLYHSLYYPKVILTFSWYTLFSQTRKWRPSHSGITVSLGMEEMPSLNMPIQRLKVTIIPLDLPYSGPVTHAGEILTTGKSYGRKPGRLLRVMKHYSTTGRRNRGRPLKRILSTETGTGQQVAQLHERYIMMMIVTRIRPRPHFFTSYQIIFL